MMTVEEFIYRCSSALGWSIKYGSYGLDKWSYETLANLNIGLYTTEGRAAFKAKSAVPGLPEGLSGDTTVIPLHDTAGEYVSYRLVSGGECLKPDCDEPAYVAFFQPSEVPEVPSYEGIDGDPPPVAVGTTRYEQEPDVPALYVSTDVLDAVTAYEDGLNTVLLLSDDVTELVEEFPGTEFIVLPVDLSSAFTLKEKLQEKGGRASVFVPPPSRSNPQPTFAEFMEKKSESAYPPDYYSQRKMRAEVYRHGDGSCVIVTDSPMDPAAASSIGVSSCFINPAGTESDRQARLRFMMDASLGARYVVMMADVSLSVEVDEYLTESNRRSEIFNGVKWAGGPWPGLFFYVQKQKERGGMPPEFLREFM